MERNTSEARKESAGLEVESGKDEDVQQSVLLNAALGTGLGHW
jgi:hypothetical protein